MRSLLHTPLDPHSRMIRLILAEKGLTVRLVQTLPTPENADLTALNPAASIPVLIDESPSGKEIAVCPETAIVEYLDEVYGAPLMLPSTSGGRAETRRLVAWFCGKFEIEVNKMTVRLRIDERRMGRAADESALIRQSAEALCWHMDYLNWLLEKRNWLAGDAVSAADFAGGAFFSSVDYLGIVPWKDFPEIKEWYARLKSRPSFKPLLKDRVEGIPPPSHFEDPDF